MLGRQRQMKKKILIADGDKDILEYLEHILVNMEYEVLAAEEGEDAFFLFEEHSPSIVLVDINMPGMDGIELLKKIKARDRNTEVIMSTGFSNMELVIESLKNEANDFVIKPIDVKALKVALKRAGKKIAMRRNYKELKALNKNFMAILRKRSGKISETDWFEAAGQVLKGVFSVFENVVRDGEKEANILNEMPFFLSIHNSRLEIVEANRVSRKRRGIEMGGRSWEIYEGAAGERSGCPAYETFKKGRGIRKKAVVKKGGIPVIVHTAPIRNSEGRVELALESYVEIPKVDQMQKRLRATQHRYQLLFDEAPCYISLQNENLEVVAANKCFVKDFGDDIGAKCFTIYARRDKPCDNCPVILTFNNGKPHSAEKIVTSKSGEKYNVLVTTGPVKDESGKIIQVMQMSINITEIRKLEDRLASIGLLIGSISHGIKNLLTSLDGGIYLVNSGFAKNDMNKTREGWEDVKLVVNRIKSMVMDILYYLKERELEFQVVDALKFANDVADTFELRLRTNEIDFKRDFDESPCSLNIDTELLHTALVNILENAFDACIEAKSKKRLCISFGMRQNEENILFEIKDNGIGMSRKIMKNMFTLFFSSKGKQGTGLGLFMANKMIEQHSGEIKVDSLPEKGSRFEVVLPKFFSPEVKNSSASTKS